MLIRGFALSLILPFMVTASAVSAPVIYTFTGVASGEADGSPFSNASFVIEVQADTDDVIPIDLSGVGFDDIIFAVQSQQASFTIDTVGSGVFTANTAVFVNQTAGVVGFTQGLVSDPLAGSQDVFGLLDSAFDSYDLRSSAGPITDPSPQIVGTPQPLASTLGEILITSVDGPATFQAAVIPEPSSLAMVGLPALLGAFWTRRRLRARA